jgi:hypothetical protein
VPFRDSAFSRYDFANVATGTQQTGVVVILNPLGQREMRRLTLAVRMLVLLSALGFLRTAVFTEPAVAQIKEVSCLMHQGGNRI